MFLRLAFGGLQRHAAIDHLHLGAGVGQHNCCSAAVADAVARGAAAADERHLAGEAGIVLRALHPVSSRYFRAN
ncbi:hypothetical protein BJA5080_00850 [Bradyrhizobium diazoefficiens SEMIA 5080]|uniref:Uncharacterized protein n=1 Tax=Bradyrhizobium diazoefficiens SEMIA 5080 TaxID=754504 RepID=A0A837CG09_9BRAD|nr:hypothetical protein BJA5080_00850 [Bradyrhizobium diazoefficiens SEMIA 5080]